MSYVPLQVKSTYSLLQSPIKIEQLIATAKQSGYQALALTDVNVMYGAIKFYDLCKQNQIKPIIGLTITGPGMCLPETEVELVLLAKSNLGYQNLLKVTTLKQTKADFQWEDLTDLLTDIAVIVPTHSEINSLLLQGKAAQFTTLIDTLKQLVPLTQVYIGIESQLSATLNRLIVKLAADNLVKLVPLDPVTYLNAADCFLVDVLQHIDNGTKMANAVVSSQETGPRFLETSERMDRVFKELNLTNALANLESLVAEIDIEIVKQQPQLPKFPNDNHVSSKAFLKDLCFKGIDKLSLSAAQATIYQKRLVTELQVIDELEFNDYFLIVWDVIRYAKEHNILVGPGRGSAAGSLVAYVLQITSVDPIKYGLLFERFLNSQRSQMPDIDLDIPDDSRDEVIKYVHQKYGHQRVAQIITFGTLAAKQALRDITRVFGLNPRQQAQWSKAIPSEPKITLQEALNESQVLKNLVADSPLNQLIMKTALQLEGIPRHFSTHAAGLVLGQRELVNEVPLQNGNEGLLMTQYSKDYVESAGLLKIDFLGLRNLTILQSTIAAIKKQQPDFNIEAIALADSQTLGLFRNGQTIGIFQFESSGIRNVLQQLQPANFEEIALVNALYRPGPMKNIPQLMTNKAHPQEINYLIPELQPILQPTYGVIVYQEQVMMIASQIADFTLNQADNLRRAISKKKLAVMEQMKQDFITGIVNKGYSQAVADQLFTYIEQFANYGFNKSHAYAYSKMAYQLAYLKSHFPGEFHVTLLNSVHNSPDKINLYINEAKLLGIKIQQPNVNVSAAEFSLHEGQIIFGLGAIKGVRRDFVREIIDNRNAEGPYQSVSDFVGRISDQFRKAELINALVYAGALDDFGFNRNELINIIPEYIESFNLSGNSLSLFKMLKPEIKHRDDLALVEKLSKEKEYLGFYVSEHPVQRYQSALKRFINLQVTNELLTANQQVNIVLYVQRIKVIRTKKGSQMAFLSASDQYTTVDLVLFPKTYQQVVGWLKVGLVVLINAKLEVSPKLQLIVNTMKPAANELRVLTPAHKWYLRVANDRKRLLLAKLNELKKPFAGNYPVVVYNEQTQKSIQLAKNYWLTNDKRVLEQLIDLLGEENVIFK